MKNKKILALTVSILLGIGTIGNSVAFADAATLTKNGEKKQERPQKTENEIIGKITEISANSVTIALANRKLPENNNQDNNGQGFKGEMPPKPPTDSNGEKQTINFDDFFTLTGESTTIDISSAKFDDFKEKMKNKNDSSDSTNTTKTYKDYSVGDYVMIELTSATSKVAKSVRSMMRGGMGPREPKQDNSQNNQYTPPNKNPS